MDPPAEFQGNYPDNRIISEGLGPELPICEAHVRRERVQDCGMNHYNLPYLWQINIAPEGYRSLPAEVNIEIEKNILRQA